jgi:hypothetical protein
VAYVCDIFNFVLVSKAYLETSGEISIYLVEDDKVIEGLPIFPELLEHPLVAIDKPGYYACTFCGHIQDLDSKTTCLVCKNDKWIAAESKRRVQ